MLVFDAWALVAWFADEEPAAERVDSLLRSHGSGDLRVHRNNVAEVLYLALRQSEERGSDVASALRALPLQIVDSDDAILWRAARIKAAHGFGFADSFAAATAVEADCALVTGDRDFEELVEAGVLEVEWLETGT